MVFIRNDIRSLYRFLGALTVLLLVSHVSAADLPGIAFYYGDHAPVGELACMDRVVVENEHISDADLHTLQARGARVHAYVSVGEAEPWRRGYAGMSKKWFLARNPDCAPETIFWTCRRSHDARARLRPPKHRHAP